MIHAEMPATKKSTPKQPAKPAKGTAATPRAAKRTVARPRERSVYAQVGDAARREAQRKLLLKTLREHDWSLVATADVLGMSGSSAVIKALKDVAPEEYDEARRSLKISSGKRRE